MCIAPPTPGVGGLGLVTDVTLQVLSAQVSRMHGRVIARDEQPQSVHRSTRDRL